MNSSIEKAFRQGHRSARILLQQKYSIPKYVFYGWLKAMNLPHWGYYIEDAGGNTILWGNGENIYLWQIFNDGNDSVFESPDGGINEWLLIHTMLNIGEQQHIHQLIQEKGIGGWFNNTEAFLEALSYGVAYVGNAYGYYIEE